MHWDLSLHKYTQHFTFHNKNSKLHSMLHKVHKFYDISAGRQDIQLISQINQ